MVKGTSRSAHPATFEYLVSIGRLTQADLNAALADALKGPQDLETILLEKHKVPKADLGRALSEYYGCPFIEFDEQTRPDPELIKNLSLDYLRKNHWIPFRREGTNLDILTADPHDLDKGLDIKRAFPGVTLRFAVALRRDIEQYLQKDTAEVPRSPLGDILGELVSEAKATEEQDDSALDRVDENNSAIVRLANQIITEAFRVGASDIHIEPYSNKKETTVRFRVDGTCATYMKIPAGYRRAIVSRLKIMANLDIAERRKPQDGKIRYKTGKEGTAEIELRVATVPTAGGNEDVVMRILTPKRPIPLDQMGFSDRMHKTLKTLVEQPHGIILCVGPTGSGKTTTLHGLLSLINTDERKIWTAEDPVEITQEGLRQVQVQPKIGLTFAAVLRAFLRSDPDVIMIGEMRDRETAEIAIEASLTGHLVLSTAHTNSAVETIVRLLDLGCDSFNFADALLGVLAKRLTKRICEACREPYHASRDEYDELMTAYGLEYWDRLGITYDSSFKLYRGRGCKECNYKGFKGRLALHELLLGSPEIRSLIQSQARTGELVKQAMDGGMTTLLQDGVEKVLKGVTTFKQVRHAARK